MLGVGLRLAGIKGSGLVERLDVGSRIRDETCLPRGSKYPNCRVQAPKSRNSEWLLVPQTLLREYLDLCTDRQKDRQIYVYIYIYMYVCIHTDLPTDLPTFLPTYLPTYIHTYIHTYMYVYVCLYVQAYVCVYIYI